eukprot:g627.t1
MSFLSGGGARLTPRKEQMEAREASAKPTPSPERPPVTVHRKDVRESREIKYQQELRTQSAASLRAKARYSTEELMDKIPPIELHRTKRASYPCLPCYDCGRACKCPACDYDELAEVILEPRLLRKQRNIGTQFDPSMLLDEGIEVLEATGAENDVEEEFARLNSLVNEWSGKCGILRDRNRKLLEEKDKLFNENVDLKEEKRLIEAERDELRDVRRELEERVERLEEKSANLETDLASEKRGRIEKLESMKRLYCGEVEIVRPEGIVLAIANNGVCDFVGRKHEEVIDKSVCFHAGFVGNWRMGKWEKSQRKVAELERRLALDAKIAETAKQTALKNLQYEVDRKFATERMEWQQRRKNENKEWEAKILAEKGKIKELEATISELRERLQKRADEMALLNKDLRRHAENADSLHDDAARRAAELQRLQRDLTGKEMELAYSRNRSPEREQVIVEREVFVEKTPPVVVSDAETIDLEALKEQIRAELALEFQQSMEIEELHMKITTAAENLRQTRERLEREQDALARQNRQVRVLEAQMDREVKTHLEAKHAFHVLLKKLKDLQLANDAKTNTIRRGRVKDPYLAENYEGQKLVNAELRGQLGVAGKRMRAIRRLAGKLKAPNSIRLLFQKLAKMPGVGGGGAVAVLEDGGGGGRGAASGGGRGLEEDNCSQYLYRADQGRAPETQQADLGSFLGGSQEQDKLFAGGRRQNREYAIRPGVDSRQEKRAAGIVDRIRQSPRQRPCSCDSWQFVFRE